ncbi:cardiolipin synthetase [Pasteurella bettyae CCUG 2042]|uniref:Cardiolipin synthase A n=1 Tax=Pasteurella bettyae CCUG 2042 TaxID=1095749 RepID=I3DI36_9PAST|nr:cardiolipin synthetase [Pasteurella bettyae CCUG 2042]
MNINLEQIIAYIVPAIMWALIVSITIRQLVKKQSSAAMLSWLMLIYLVPIVGILAYLIFGEINLGKRRSNISKQLLPKYMLWFANLNKQKKLLIDSSQSSIAYPLFELAQRRLGIPCIQGNELHILDTPESIIKNIIKDIQQAKQSINMVFYIWSNGGLIDFVETALIEAKQRGVNVHILLDSVGSRDFLKSTHCKQLIEQGIEIEEALHVNLWRIFLRRIDLRQHRKIIVIDNQISYTGSMNMVDPDYFKQGSNVGKWVDIMVRIDGPVSPVLNGLHAWDWEMETQQELEVPLPSQQRLPMENNNIHAVQVLATGPGLPDDLMVQSLVTAIFSANQSITITTPYFVPSQNIIDALEIAALRGVNVSLILPMENDSLMVKWASRNYFDTLLKAGVKIYTFTQGLLHTKSILIDNQLVMVGTVNMDMRSFHLNFEVTLLIEDQVFANEISLLHENYMNESELIDENIWFNRSVITRIIEKLFFLFSPLL